MRRLQEIRIMKIVPGPDTFFVSAGYEDWQTELQILYKTDGRAYGKTNQNRWVELSNETTGVIRNKVRQYVAASSNIQ